MDLLQGVNLYSYILYVYVLLQHSGILVNGDLNICESNSLKTSTGTLHTPQYPDWYSADFCRCSITAIQQTYLLITIFFENRYKSVLEDEKCLVKWLIKSDRLASFNVCPTSKRTFSFVIALQHCQVLQAVIDNTAGRNDSFFRSTFEYSAQPNLLDVHCRRGPGGIFLPSDSPLYFSNKYDSPKRRMAVIAIAVVASIIGVLVLIAIWACLFYKYYIKRRRKRQKDEANSGQHLKKTNNEPATTVASKVLNANQAFNLAYDDSLENGEGDLKSAHTNGSVPNGSYNGAGTRVYTEQYSSDSGASFSEMMDIYGHNSVSGISRHSGSDSEGNRSVRFAEALPTLRGDEPPVDGRPKIPKTKMGYWIKPPATPRGKKPLPFQYVGNVNPTYSKAAVGRRVNPKNVMAVSVKVPQKTGKRRSREIQQLQPSDVVVSDPISLDQLQPKSKSRKVTSDSSQNAFPLLDNVQTAGRPPGGNKPVRQRSILKKPKAERDQSHSNGSVSQSENSMTSQSATDNSLSETEGGVGIVPQTVQRRSKRRRPKSIRNVGNNNNSSENTTPVYGNPPTARVHAESYKSVKTDSTPPIAQSSPQTPRYQHSPDSSYIPQPGQQSFNSSVSSEVKPHMPYAYYPPKSPGDRVLDDDLDQLPYAKPKVRSKDFVNPYESAANKKTNRSSSDLDSNYFSAASPLSNGEAVPPNDLAVESRQKRRRKKSTKRTNKPNVNQNTTVSSVPQSPTKYDNIAFVDDEVQLNMYNTQSVRPQAVVRGSHSSETEI